MAVLTALSDDDEEIRELAAKVVAKITGEDVIPEAAVPILCKWMQDRYTKQDGPDPQYEPHPDWHRRFYDAFVSGLRNPRTRRPVKPTKERLGEPLVEEEMAEAMKEDNALFVEESQNLYIDEVQEIRKWLSFLTNDKDFALIIPMHEVMEGTQSNLRKFRKYVHQYDGPFGWSSKPEVFGILMKVILAAQTFNRYTRKWDPELDYQDSWGDLEGDCVVAAHMLWAIGKKNALHPLIMAELKKVYPIKCPTVGYCERCENGMPDKELKKREDEVREDGEGFSGESEDEDEEDHFGRGGGTDEEESEDETEVKAESEDSEGGGVAV